MTFRGHFENGVIILEESVELENGTPVQVEVVTDDRVKGSFADRYREFAGSIDGLPEDFAEHHDHYLHGKPSL